MTLLPDSAASSDWAAASQLATPWATIWPLPTASFTDATALVWRVVDPALADLCRCRMAMLLGEPVPAARPGLGSPHEAQVASLAQWPTSAAFSAAERACLAFTEQFVMDVGSMTPELVAPVNDALGDRTPTFVQALFLLDVGTRMDLVLPRLFGTGTAAARPGSDAPRPAAGALAADTEVELWPAIANMLQTVARMGELDVVTSELVRLRGARFHRCRICQSRLSLSALEAVGDRRVLDQVDTYESSELSESQKVALRLTDAMVTQPATDLDQALVSAVRHAFTPAQAVEIVYDVARNATNKFAVALGVDAPVVSEGFELFDIDDAGDVVADADAGRLRSMLSGSTVGTA